MKIKLEEFQEACKVILGSVDNKLSTTSQEDKGYNALELIAEGRILHLNVASMEYYVSVNLNLETEETFRAVIDAKVFLKLVSKLTSSSIELNVEGTNLVLTGSGRYTFPLKLDVNNNLIKLPKININNVTANFAIDSAILASILKYNLNELETNSDSISKFRPAQSSLYLDQNCCIAWTQSSICVNSFKLTNPIKILLNQKIVRLFKLFKEGDVNFTLGFEEVGAKLQTRIRFQSENIDITSIADNDVSLMNSVPIDAIRGLVEKTFPYSVNINTADLVGALQRLMLFETNIKTDADDISSFVFDSEKLTINKKENSEVVFYDNTYLSIKHLI